MTKRNLIPFILRLEKKSLNKIDKWAKKDRTVRSRQQYLENVIEAHISSVEVKPSADDNQQVYTVQ